MTLQELEKQALQLPPADRELLAARLLESVHPEGFERMDDETYAELERRWDELKSGKVQGLSADQVHQNIRSAMGWNV